MTRVQDGSVHRGSLLAGSVLLGMLASAAGLTIAAASSAAAASCTAKVTISGPSHGHLVLSPSSVKVQVGNCVEYVNSATSKVTLTISQGSRTVFGPRDIAKGSATSFTPSSAGRDTVSASSQVLLLKFTGGGSVTATAPSSPHPTKSGSPKPTPKTSKSPSKHPNVAPNPKHPHKQANKNGKSQKKQTPQPHATGIKLPPLPPLPSVGVTALPKGSKPLVAPGETVPPAVAQPGTNSTSPVAAVLSGPIEPLDSNRRGLPVAVGVLVVLGIATGWGRVLLAASGPGDKRSKGDHKI